MPARHHLLGAAGAGRGLLRGQIDNRRFMSRVFFRAKPTRPTAQRTKVPGSGTLVEPPPLLSPPPFVLPPSTVPVRVKAVMQRTFSEPSLMQPLEPRVAVVSNSFEQPPMIPLPGHPDVTVKTV